MPLSPDSGLADVRREAADRVDTLRIARTGSVSRAAVDRLRIRSLQEDPCTRLNMYELPLAHQIRGLHGDLLDVGLSMSPFSDSMLRCVPLWRGEVVATVPARHGLAQAQRVALKELAGHPLVLCNPDDTGAGAEPLVRMIRAMGTEPVIAECVACHQLMTTLVAAGYGLGISLNPDPDHHANAEVVSRPLIGWLRRPTTYLLYRPARANAAVRRYIDRAVQLSHEQRENP